jgi:hypothetical protein
LERLKRLSGLLAEYALPDALTGAEAFRAQLALRLPLRTARRMRYASWPWYAIPLCLIGVLVSLQALLSLPAALGGVVSLVGWLGFDLGSLLSSAGAPEWSAAFSDVLGSPLFVLLTVIWQMTVCGALCVITVPYVGWVSVLWRSRIPPVALQGAQVASLPASH